MGGGGRKRFLDPRFSHFIAPRVINDLSLRNWSLITWMGVGATKWEKKQV